MGINQVSSKRLQRQGMDNHGTILLVNDDADILKTTRHVLEKAGYQVRTAQDGAQALEQARIHQPELILLDVNLPDMSGLEVCRQIKADPALKDIYVVMLSATFTDPDSQAKGLEIGADGYIARPIENRELTARVQAMLRIKQTEQALKKGQLETRVLYEAMTEMFALHELVYDKAGTATDYRILDCNPAFERVLGIPCEQATGRLASELYGTGQAPYLDLYAPVAETGVPVVFETEFAPMGKVFKISVFSPERGRFATLSTDITLIKKEIEKAQGLLEQTDRSRRALVSILEDRKLMEAALRESQRRLDLALQSAQMGVWSLDFVTGKRNFDEQTCRMLGIDPATFSGEADAFYALVHPEDREFVKAALQRTIEKDVLYEPEFRIIRPDGSQHYNSVRGTLVRDPSGKAIGINGIGWDITERKQLELERAHQAEELARLYRASTSLLSGSALDVKALSQTILKTVMNEFGQTNSSLFLVENDPRRLTRIAAVGPYADQVSRVELTLDGPGLVPQAIRSGAAINSADVQSNPTYVSSWEAAGSEMTIPLKIGERVIGVIDMQDAKPGAFSEEDVRLMVIFAERAALALEHARLYSQTERRLENLTALRAVDTAIASSFDISFTLGILLNQVIRQLDVDAANVLTFNAATMTFQNSAAQGIQVSAPGHSSLRLGDSLAGQVVRERRTISVDALTSRAEDQHRNSELIRKGFTSYMGVPLIAKGLVKGVLEIHRRSSISLDQEQQALLDMLAGQAAIAIDSSQLFDNLQGSNAELMLAYDETIEGWSQAMDLRDKETEGHSLRVTQLTVKLAASLDTSPEELIHIRRGALLHDIGKLGVPDEILRKTGPLTDEEWVIMRAHPQLAYDLLSSITYLQAALDIPYCHHEKWNGTGYPRGLKENQIPLSARIFAVVDVWDALTSDRPYRAAWSEEKTLAYIQEQSGTHFDPKVVSAFVREIGERRTQ